MNVQPRATAGRRDDRQRAANKPDAFLDAEQPESATGERHRGFETAALIADRQLRFPPDRASDTLAFRTPACLTMLRSPSCAMR